VRISAIGAMDIELPGGEWPVLTMIHENVEWYTI